MRWQAQNAPVGRTYSSDEREKNNWRLKMLTLKWQSVTDRDREAVRSTVAKYRKPFFRRRLNTSCFGLVSFFACSISFRFYWSFFSHFSQLSLSHKWANGRCKHFRMVPTKKEAKTCTYAFFLYTAVARGPRRLLAIETRTAMMKISNVLMFESNQWTRKKCLFRRSRITDTIHLRPSNPVNWKLFNKSFI